MQKIISKHTELLWIVGLSILLYACAYFPVFRNFQRVATDRFYYGSEEFPIDQIGNLAYVRQGYEGDTFATFNYSIFLGQHPSIVKFEYILIGRIARLVRTDPVSMFRFTQFLLSLCYLCAVYLIIRKSISALRDRLIAYTLVLFGTGVVLPWDVFSFTENAVYDVGVFIRMMLAQPHYMLGGVCSMMSIYFLSRALEKHEEYRFFILAVFLGILTSFFYAPNMVIIVSGFPLYLIFRMISRYIHERKIQVSMTEVSMLFTYSLIIAIPILYIRYIVGTYWQDLNTAKMEFINPFILTFVQYLAAIGMTYILSIFALPSVVKKGNTLMLLFATWVVMHPLGEFVLSRFLHLNPIRYFLTPYYIVFGILAGITVANGIRFIQQRLLHNTQRSVNHVSILLMLLVFGTSVVTYQKSFKRATNCFCQQEILDFGYPQKTIMDSMRWLETHTSNDDIVLSGYHAGMIIPAFAGNRVYTSWWYKLIEPPSFPTVLDALAALYRQGVTAEDAYAFVKKTGISYVYYSQEEHLLNPSVWGLNYPFLKEVYNQGEVIIYKVQTL